MVEIKGRHFKADRISAWFITELSNAWTLILTVDSCNWSINGLTKAEADEATKKLKALS
jgi:hypothetical protein